MSNFFQRGRCVVLFVLIPFLLISYLLIDYSRMSESENIQDDLVLMLIMVLSYFIVHYLYNYKAFSWIEEQGYQLKKYQLCTKEIIMAKPIGIFGAVAYIEVLNESNETMSGYLDLGYSLGSPVTFYPKKEHKKQ